MFLCCLFLQFFQQLFVYVRKIIDEVQRVLYLMCNACSKVHLVKPFFGLDELERVDFKFSKDVLSSIVCLALFFQYFCLPEGPVLFFSSEVIRPALHWFCTSVDISFKSEWQHKPLGKWK